MLVAEYHGQIFTCFIFAQMNLWNLRLRQKIFFKLCHVLTYFILNWFWFCRLLSNTLIYQIWSIRLLLCLMSKIGLTPDLQNQMKMRPSWYFSTMDLIWGKISSSNALFNSFLNTMLLSVLSRRSSMTEEKKLFENDIYGDKYHIYDMQCLWNDLAFIWNKSILMMLSHLKCSNVMLQIPTLW